MLERAYLESFLLAMPGAAEDYKAEWGWTRFRVGERMYAALCQPGPEHAPMYAGHPLLTLKCDPLESEGLRQHYPDILPGFYSDKRTWISIRLDGEVMYAGHPLLTLKCDPLESEGLRQHYPDILPGFYSDKRTWISIRLDGEVPQELIVHLCEASYRLVFEKLTRKMQREILNTAEHTEANKE